MPTKSLPIETIIEVYKTGLTAKETAAQLKLNYNQVYDTLHRFGVLRARGGIDIINGEKKCSTCKKMLSLEQFDKRKNVENGYRPDCKKCRAERERITRVRYSTKPIEEKRAILEKNREIKLRTPSRMLLNLARRRARQKKLSFNIEETDITIPESCPILQIPLIFNRKAVQHNSPTLDRIVNSKGYVKGNVQVISWKANKLKSNGTIEELELIIKYLKSIRNV